MFLKNEDVKIGTIPDANGSDNPLKKMEFLTEKEMKDNSRLFGKLSPHTHRHFLKPKQSHAQYRYLPYAQKSVWSPQDKKTKQCQHRE